MRLSDFIFCEDVRSDARGLSLLNVYNDELSVPLTDPSGPFGVRLGIFVRWLLEDGDPLPQVFELFLRQGEQLLLTDRKPIIVRNPSKSIVQGINLHPLALPGSGEFSVEIFLRHNERILAPRAVRSIRFVAQSPSVVQERPLPALVPVG